MILCGCGNEMEALAWAGISPVRLVCRCGVVRVYEWSDRGILQGITTMFRRRTIVLQMAKHTKKAG